MSLTKQFEILRNGKEGDLEYEMALAEIEVALGDMQQHVERTLSAIEQRVEQQAERLTELEIRNSRKKRRFGI